MSGVDLPLGQTVELEFVREGKPPQRGVLPEPLDQDRPGFEFIEVRVPEGLGFAEPFRVALQRKWVNLATIAEIRYLPAGALETEVSRLAELHRQVQRRMEQR